MVSARSGVTKQSFAPEFARMKANSLACSLAFIGTAHRPACHTTGRAAALHSETYGSAEIRAITVASGRFYRKPPTGFADHPLLTPRGAIISGRAEQQADMQKNAAEFAGLVPSVRWLDPA